MKNDRPRMLVVAAIGCVLIAITANVSHAQKAETYSAHAVRHSKEKARRRE